MKQQTEQREPIQEPVQRLQHTSQQEQVQVQKQDQQVQQELSRACKCTLQDSNLGSPAPEADALSIRPASQ